jgi:hypothetical protein
MSRPESADLIQEGTGQAVSQRKQPGPGVAREAREVPGLTPAAPEDLGDDEGNGLILSVRAKRAEVEGYLRAIGARRRRLVTITIVAAAISTLLVASPALGGQPLANWLTETFSLPLPAWRILCAVAAVCSLTAAVATQLHTSKNYEEHIARAQEINATLEMLEAGVTLNHLNQDEATSQYLKIIENTSFIDAVR